MANSVSKKAYAKINIGLDIVGKTDNGYHLLNSIMQQVDLYDVITVSREDEDGYSIAIDSNNHDIPLDETNLAYKAADILMKEYKLSGKVSIYIDKRIPMAAGMAGGSTDGAAVLELINELYKLGLSKDELKDIGVKLGADIPFCIEGKGAICRGIGEIMTPLGTAPDMAVLIAKPPISISTKYVYTHLKLDSLNHPDMDKVITAYKSGDLKTVADFMGNVLESVSEKENEIITSLKASMLEEGAVGSLMSGSGPTVFGLFENMTLASKAGDKMKEKYPDVFIQAVNLIK